MDIEESDKIHRVSEIDDHRKMGRSWEVLVSWNDGSQTWQQLSTMAKDSPIKMANYAKENNLLEEEKWKRFRDLLKNDQNTTNIRNKNKIYLNHYNHGPIFKFGIQIHRNYKEATRLDIKNGNYKWDQASKKEMEQVINIFDTFKDCGKYDKNAPAPIP